MICCCVVFTFTCVRVGFGVASGGLLVGGGCVCCLGLFIFFRLFALLLELGVTVCLGGCYFLWVWVLMVGVCYVGVC